MNIGEQDLEKFVLLRVMRLNAIIQGVVFGLVMGGVIFIATLWLVVKGGPVIGPHLGLLNQFFIGYDVTLLGSLIGFGYGFVFGFVTGFLTAKIYNLLAGWRETWTSAGGQPIQVPVRTPLRQSVVSARQKEYANTTAGSNGRDHARAESE